MPRLLRMPEVAANAVEAVLQEWKVEENAAFSSADVLATVETEKAVVDVEADAEGVLLKTLVPNGAQVEVGAPIALLADASEQVGDLDAVMQGLGVTANGAVVTPERREVPDLSGAEDGVPQPDEAPASVPAEVPAVSAVSAATRGGERTGERIFVSPLARRIAQERGLALGSIAGSGPRGRILRRDVDAASAGGIQGTVQPGVAAGESAPAATPSRATTSSEGQGFTDVPHSRMRRAIATRLSESKQTVPHFYVRATVQVDELLAVRAQLNDAGDLRVSVTDLLVKAVARAHVLVPAMNVVWTEGAVRAFSSVDVSLAVATDRGLVTPVLRGVQTMPVSAVVATARDLVARAKSGELRQDELEGGSVAVTNLGMFGTEEFAAIINPPQSAILAVGAARQEPVVRDGRLEVGTVMHLTLSVDHRPIDGVVAAQWMQALVGLLEHPVRILV